MAISSDKMDPKAREIMDRLTAGPPLSTLTPEQARALPVPIAAAPEAVGAVTQVSFPGPGGFLRLRIYRPKAEPLGALVYFHGGGWVVGSLEGADATCRALTNRAASVVVSVDYRLAPETKFPGPVEDAYAAVRWVSEAAAELGVDAGRIGVGGSSAGGNLAAAAAKVARDRGGPAIAFQVLSVPVTDLGLATPSYDEFSEGYGLTRADMHWYAAHYLTAPTDAEHPYASVARGDLKGLPPAFVVTAECDPLRDEAEIYVERLRGAGVAATAKRYPGMPHGFVGLADLVEARRAVDDVGAALREAFAS